MAEQALHSSDEASAPHPAVPLTLSAAQAVADQDSRIEWFKSEVTKQQETQAAGFTRDTERLQTNLEKVRSEIRWVGGVGSGRAWCVCAVGGRVGQGLGVCGAAGRSGEGCGMAALWRCWHPLQGVVSKVGRSWARWWHNRLVQKNC